MFHSISLLQKERSGALVTPEIFLAWRDSFEQELRDRQEMLGVASLEIEKRPTGKEFLSPVIFNQTNY